MNEFNFSNIVAFVGRGTHQPFPVHAVAPSLDIRTMTELEIHIKSDKKLSNGVPLKYNSFNIYSSIFRKCKNYLD